MTDDLVKRLRTRRDRSVVLTSYPPQFPPDSLCQEAADRIEQLEAALREIVAMTPDPEFGTPPIGNAIKVARAALGEKKDD